MGVEDVGLRYEKYIIITVTHRLCDNGAGWVKRYHGRRRVFPFNKEILFPFRKLYKLPPLLYGGWEPFRFVGSCFSAVFVFTDCIYIYI